MFTHPPGWNPEKYVSISSDRCGRSLVNKLRTYHGDNLEGLQAIIGAPVTYSDEHKCLISQLPESRAFAGQRKLNNELETARKRVAGEWNEINIVGTTRIIVGKGGTVSAVLTGNQCLSLIAKEVKSAEGGDAATRKQIAEIMREFDEEVVVTRLGSKQDWKITFQSVDNAEGALAAYPNGPWAILRPMIQKPRASTLVQTCNVIVTYPLKVNLEKERRVILKEMLEPMGVKMSDVHVHAGDKLTGKGQAVIRMQSPTDVARAVEQFHGRRFPKLSGRIPLTVEADVSFSAVVSGLVFKALWIQLYKEKQIAKRAGVTVELEPPRRGHQSMVKILGAGEAVAAAHKDSIKATRARIEKLLEGHIISFNRDVIHLLASKEGREELDKLMDECKEVVETPPEAAPDMPQIKCLAIVCEKESSQVRLFGPKLWMDEAERMIRGLAMSHTFSEQISHFSISKEATVFLSRSDQQNRIEKIRADTGAVSCSFSRTQSSDGRGQITVKGTPMSIQTARIHIKHLESDARAGTNIAVTAGMYGASNCPVCLCDIEEADMYILEPCGHAYCKDCAPQLMKNGSLPIVCCKDGCGEVVCMEDVKIGICTGPGQYDLALQKAFNNYINQNHATFGRCYGVNCKQVFTKRPSMSRFDCDHCMESFCTACSVSWHEGKTCAEFQARLKENCASERWTQENTRPCPSCSAPFYKDGGCNRVQCANCKTYICNVCLESFATSGDCYNHLTASHGSFYD